MHVSPQVVAGLHFVAGGEFASWLEEQSPPAELRELVGLLRAMREAALNVEVPSLAAAPLLESLLSHPWLIDRCMPLAVHKELLEAEDLLPLLR